MPGGSDPVGGAIGVVVELPVLPPVDDDGGGGDADGGGVGAVAFAQPACSASDAPQYWYTSQHKPGHGENGIDKLYAVEHRHHCPRPKAQGQAQLQSVVGSKIDGFVLHATQVLTSQQAHQRCTTYEESVEVQQESETRRMARTTGCTSSASKLQCSSRESPCTVLGTLRCMPRSRLTVKHACIDAHQSCSPPSHC
jgi:hypothetical protein